LTQAWAKELKDETKRQEVPTPQTLTLEFPVFEVEINKI
jgi:hypothetical protein